jgi:hypothetical protein
VYKKKLQEEEDRRKLDLETIEFLRLKIEKMNENNADLLLESKKKDK